MIIPQIVESIAMAEKETGMIIQITGTEVTLTTQTIIKKETGVITVITGTEIMLTTQTIASTEITEAIGIPSHTEITEVTESTETTSSTGA